MKTCRAIVLFSCLGLAAMSCSLFGLIGSDSGYITAVTFTNFCPVVDVR